MVFAPSGDLTDDPAQHHLYLVDGALPAGLRASMNTGASGVPAVLPDGSRIYLPLLQAPNAAMPERAASAASLRPSRILEFSFAEQSLQMDAAQAAAVMSFTSTVIQTIPAWEWNPPSPDSSGIVYLPGKNRLLVSDGEVDETVVITHTDATTESITYYEGVNMWQTTLDGSVDDTWTTLVDQDTGGYSDEPTGVALNPANNHLFITDDTGPRTVYEVNPGPDGNYGTGDDVVTSFSTGTYDGSAGFGCLDPEGITYVPTLDVLFIIDGLNREVYRVSPGPDGLFNGVAPDGDDQATHFDIASMGVTDPEGIAYSAYTGTLYIAGANRDFLFETTTTGTLVRILDVTAANAKSLAGLEYAPSSIDPNLMSLYVVDRGVDNNFLPDRVPNDGRVYEFTLPQVPVANDDTATTPEDTSKIIDVAANDTDADDNLDPASANTGCDGCAKPSHGTLTNNGDGTFTYQPAAGYVGLDTFVYEICDEDAQCATATVTVSVSGTNLAPVAQGDTATTPKDTSKLIDVAANDTDPDDNLDPASANTGCSGCSTPAHGTLTNNGDGTFTYTPEAGYTGDDAFAYEICDSSGLCDTATVNITVSGTNAAPAAKNDSATTSQDKPVDIDVAANDTDADGNLDPTSANTACDGCSTPSHGTLTNNGDGTFTYEANPGFTGADSFVYEICDDGALCDTATVTVNVTVKTTNTAPDAVDDTVTTTKGGPVLIDVAANDTDAEGNLDRTSAGTKCGDCVPPAHGTVVDNGNGTITYTPTPGFNGTDSFVYEICDSGLLCDIALVTVTVKGNPDTNRPPAAKNDSAKTDEATPVNIDVAANDTDPDGNLVPGSANTECDGCSTPSHGSLTNNGDGTFTYTPEADFNGNDSFVYEICDSGARCDTATVTVAVTATSVGGGPTKLHLPLITR
jgi:hypothetical protein